MASTSASISTSVSHRPTTRPQCRGVSLDAVVTTRTDILKHAEHWSGFTRHFGPPSGSDPKLARAKQRYLLTVFGYGCNLGPYQTARHAPEVASAQALRRTNAQHVTGAKLEAGMADLIGQYARFSLPRYWGGGRAAIADGTHVKLRENNLLGSRHVRYRG
ncbi:MAG TPA: Tn3 family transposase, partial [Gaiellales bacterium]|nr:Tn3 family transposase [Gaiellales bacterium]